jgi:RNA 2',3'-cyclic 3'-phosphodiesterase
VRLFFAVELPSEVRSALSRLQPHNGAEAYRWVDPSLMHVTLAFLGEQPGELVPKLEAIAGEAAGGARSATLRIGEVGWFGPRSAPRVLCVGLDGDLDALGQLQARLDAALRNGGFGLEDRAFRAHITLARRRERAAGGPVQWPPARIEHPTFPMNALTLFQSRLSPRGPTYTALLRAPMRMRA